MPRPDDGETAQEKSGELDERTTPTNSTLKMAFGSWCLRRISWRCWVDANFPSMRASTRNVQTEAQKRVLQQTKSADASVVEAAETRDSSARRDFDERYRVIEKDHMFTGLTDHRLVHAGSFGIDDFAQKIIQSADANKVLYSVTCYHLRTRTRMHANTYISTYTQAHTDTDTKHTRKKNAHSSHGSLHSYTATFKAGSNAPKRPNASTHTNKHPHAVGGQTSPS